MNANKESLESDDTTDSDESSLLNLKHIIQEIKEQCENIENQQTFNKERKIKNSSQSTLKCQSCSLEMKEDRAFVNLYKHLVDSMFKYS